MPTRTVEVHNACLVIAMRELLDEPQWGPKEIVQLIIDNDGFPGDLNDTIYQYAPVARLGACSVESDGFQITFQTCDRMLRLWWWERIIVTVKRSEKRAHFACIAAGEIFAQTKEVLDIIVRVANEA